MFKDNFTSCSLNDSAALEAEPTVGDAEVCVCIPTIFCGIRRQAIGITHFEKSDNIHVIHKTFLRSVPVETSCKSENGKVLACSHFFYAILLRYTALAPTPQLRLAPRHRPVQAVEIRRYAKKLQLVLTCTFIRNQQHSFLIWTGMKNCGGDLRKACVSFLWDVIGGGRQPNNHLFFKRIIATLELLIVVQMSQLKLINLTVTAVKTKNRPVGLKTVITAGWDLWCDPVGGGEPAKRSGSAEPGALCAPARGHRPSGGRVQGGGRPLPPRVSGGITPGKFLRFYMQNPAFRRTFRLTN
jgi:hypothetical protein